MKRYFLPILLLLSVLTACDDTLSSSLTRHTVSFAVNLPDEIEPESAINGRITFRNVSTGAETVGTPEETVTLIPGLYDFAYQATALLATGAETTLRFTRNSVNIRGDITLTVNPFSYIESNDLIIAEIFFAGTLNPSGISYSGDDYIKLYNNTDDVIYADGLALVESKFSTTQKYDYTPDIMDEAVTVDAIYVIPGSGCEHPVKPGEYLLLADTGIDHTRLNPYSFNLEHADFEWYDVSTSPAHLDIDSPTVPNLDKWYCYTHSYFMLHNRGFKAYGLARIAVEKDEYLRDYKYDYEYTVVTDAGSFPMSGTAYKIPNDWVVDMVNCSLKASYVWVVCAPMLDMGWTSCGEIDKDKDRFFHSVRRKLLYLNQYGNPVFKDTNNSTADFNRDCVASEIELAGSVMDATGTCCTCITYDGLTPIAQ
ncbi:MAG: DUF4876 domain-containing protein [Muribaculaceae bacterium]|nr:DUF4876 domain-containing protein [Muribaculaceae bacterium]